MEQQTMTALEQVKYALVQGRLTHEEIADMTGYSVTIINSIARYMGDVK